MYMKEIEQEILNLQNTLLDVEIRRKQLESALRVFSDNAGKVAAADLDTIHATTSRIQGEIQKLREQALRFAEAHAPKATTTLSAAMSDFRR